MQPSQPSTPDSAATLPPDAFNNDSVLNQFRDVLGTDGDYTLDKTFKADEYPYVIVTKAGSHGHHIYLANVWNGVIQKCVELESVEEPAPSASVYRYTDVTFSSDTLFYITAYTERVMDSSLIVDDTLIPPNTFATVRKDQQSVDDPFMPCMLLSDTVRPWPHIWRAMPPLNPSEMPAN